MPKKIYLEYEESIIQIEGEDQEEQQISTIIPICLYRQPINNAIEIPTSIDTEKYYKLHIVVVFFIDNSKGEEKDGWVVVDVLTSRRAAKDVEASINSGTYPSHKAFWDKGSFQLLSTDVFSLDIE